jgi:hypothetical protein
MLVSYSKTKFHDVSPEKWSYSYVHEALTTSVKKMKVQDMFNDYIIQLRTSMTSFTEMTTHLMIRLNQYMKFLKNINWKIKYVVHFAYSVRNR